MTTQKGFSFYESRTAANDNDNRYGTKRWRRLSQQTLCAADWRCSCGAYASVVHHIDKAYRLFFEPTNLVALCRSCHASIERLGWPSYFKPESYAGQGALPPPVSLADARPERPERSIKVDLETWRVIDVRGFDAGWIGAPLILFVAAYIETTGKPYPGLPSFDELWRLAAKRAA